MQGTLSQRICYRGHRHPSGLGEQEVMSLPSVSCILPCGYGDEYVGLAIQCFMDQTYEGPLELVIVDNNDEPGPAFTSERVKYVRAPRGKTVGEYRNLGTQHATGEICITWDEDDWS